MRTTTSSFAVMLTIALASVALAEDRLFSSVSIDSVYGPSSSTGSTGNIQPPVRVAGPATLSDMLQRAGLEPKELSTQVISVNITRERWAMPVLFTLNEDRTQIRMVMMLNTLDEKQSLSADKLMALLDANRESDRATFAYSTSRRRIELHRVLDNRSITSDKLLRGVNELADIAEKSEDLWTIDANSATTNSTTAEVADAKPEASPPPADSQTLSLVGTWSAARSKTQAFALQIKSDGSFNMVTASGGKTAKSTGKYTISGATLTLVDTNGTKLSGNVEQTSTKEFKFSPVGSKDASASVTFKRAT